MKIIKFQLKTSKGEVVKLNEIATLSFGMLTSCTFDKAETQELFITCKQGQLRFNLEDIRDISFTLDQEKFLLGIASGCFAKEEKNGKI